MLWRVAAVWVLVPGYWVLGIGSWVLGQCNSSCVIFGRRDERAAKAVEPWCSVVLRHTGIPAGQDMNVYVYLHESKECKRLSHDTEYDIN